MERGISGSARRKPAAVVKRDGKNVAFDRAKIESAQARAGAATGEFAAQEAARLARRVGRTLAVRVGDSVHVEAIQDAVELALLRAGHLKTTRAYVVYREQHAKLRTDRKTMVDVAASVNEYLDQEDWRVNANANQGYSLGGLILNVSGKVIANYWLAHVYAPEISHAHRNADVHIHDLDMLAGYCAGATLARSMASYLTGSFCASLASKFESFALRRA
jgi:ribonucleoside-triphosphate reductase (formate)